MSHRERNRSPSEDELQRVRARLGVLIDRGGLRDVLETDAGGVLHELNGSGRGVLAVQIVVRLRRRRHGDRCHRPLDLPRQRRRGFLRRRLVANLVVGAWPRARRVRARGRGYELVAGATRADEGGPRGFDGVRRVHALRRERRRWETRRGGGVRRGVAFRVRGRRGLYVVKPLALGVRVARLRHRHKPRQPRGRARARPRRHRGAVDGEGVEGALDVVEARVGGEDGRLQVRRRHLHHAARRDGGAEADRAPLRLADGGAAEGNARGGIP
mmetsp:Transcript_48756/g.150554  ORF Transcript_48756/g.150554 Transcript_48756/m.150554 type:complete len:271 (-) Transcript_48756:432-1244(-)